MRVGLLLCLSLLAVSSSWAEILDMTHTFDEDAKHFPGGQSDFHLVMLHKGLSTNGKYWIQHEDMTSGIHVGTHMDAPRHFNENGWSIDEIPPERLFRRPAVMMDIRQKAAQSPEAFISVDDIIKYEEMYGEIPKGAVIVQCSGWSDKYDNKLAYFGNDRDDMFNFHFPGFHVDTVRWLIHNRDIYGLAVDGPSLDKSSESVAFPVHVLFCSHNIYALENVKNTCSLPPAGAMIYLLPSKVKDGSGGHTRVIAEWNNETSAAMTLLVTLTHLWMLCAVVFVQIM